jgi:hypothetical protein
MLGMYKHIRTQKLYNVIKIAQSVVIPNQQFMVYEQLYESVLRETGTKLPIGSVWIRESEDFKAKFEKVD